MPGMNSDIEVNGIIEVISEVRATKERAERYSKRIVEAGAKAGYQAMWSSIPRRSGDLQSRLYVTDAKYSPGGSAGGGTWEAEAGLRAEQTAWGHDIGSLILRGTGFHGPFMTPISATDGGDWTNTFPITGQGPTLLFRQSQLGMEAQTEWVEKGQEAASAMTDLFTQRVGEMLAARG